MWEQHQRSGVPEDLDRALDVWTRMAVDATDVADRYPVGHRIGLAFERRFAISADPADLDRAIEHYEGILVESPGDWPDRTACLSDLARALRERGHCPKDKAVSGGLIRSGC